MTRGSTFDRDKDGERIDAQLARVRALMLDGRWRTLEEVGAACGAPEASVSARLRDLRKHGLVVDRERVPNGNGLHRYRVRIPAQPRGQMTLFPVKGGA